MTTQDRTQPTYLNTDDIETLARQNTQLMAELWIVKDRLFVLEEMLAEKGLIDREVFNSTEPSEVLSKELDAERAAYIKRIIGVRPEERTIERLKDMAPKLG